MYNDCENVKKTNRPFLCDSADVLISSEKLRDLLSPVQYCMDSDDWVTLCDVRDNWTRNDATVICRQSGRYSEGYS